MAGILDWIDQNLGTRLGLLVNDPRAAIEQMNSQAGAYNQASILATQAERNALRGLPVTPEQAAAKQYVDKATEDVAMGFAGTTIGSGLQKIRSEAKGLTEKQFLDKYVTQTMPEHLVAKQLPEGVASQKPHDFLPPGLLEPSEWSSWADRAMTGTPEKIKSFRSAMQKGDVFPPVLIHARKGEFPSVEDGHHRVAAYLDEGTKTIPVSLDIDSLIKIWKDENKSNKKISEIYQDYKKTLK